MKHCPQCSQTYTDDNTFCMNDGTGLLSESGSNETILRQHNSSKNQTQVISNPQVRTASVKNGSSNSLYLVIGLMSVVILVMGLFMFMPTEDKTKENEYGSVKSEKSDSVSKPADVADKKSYSADEKNEDDSNNADVKESSPIKFETPKPTPEIPKTSPNGRWTGDWSAPSGAYLTVIYDLSDDGKGNINGQIEWTLRRTSRPEKQSKVGLSAIEYVRGRYNSANQTLTLKGYRKSDPNKVLVMLDNYRLVLSKDERRLNGSAKNGGRWDGKINLSRQ